MFAWEVAENGAWTDPEFLRIHENNGVAVQVGGRARYRYRASDSV